MLQLQQMRTRVGEILEDSSFVQWPSTLVDQYINDAAQDFAIRTKCIRKYTSSPLSADNDFETLGTGVTNASPNKNKLTSLTLPSSWRAGSNIYGISGGNVNTTAIPAGTTVVSVDVANSSLIMSTNAVDTPPNTITLTDRAYAFYNVPTDIHEIESIWVNGYHVPQGRIDRMPYQWDIETCSSTSEPTCYLYGDFGFDVIRFWPYPTDAAFPNVRVYYTALPPAMTTGTATPIGIPKRYNIALVYYTVAMCYRKNFEDADKAKSEEFMALYLDQIRDCQGRIERLLNAEGMGVPYRHL